MTYLPAAILLLPVRALNIISVMIFYVFVLYFDIRLGQICHSKWCTRRKWHIPMASNRKSSRGRIWLMKWDKVKSPWYTHWLMHRKGVTSELHDSYFRLITIKHAIPRIEWAIEWAIDRKSDSWSKRRDMVGKATSGRKGPRDPRWSFGDQLVIRCSKESHHPAESWAPGPPFEPWRTWKTQRWRP